MEMKIILSIPNTISSKVRVIREAHISGFRRKSIKKILAKITV
jgi:hypothetical protein